MAPAAEAQGGEPPKKKAKKAKQAEEKKDDRNISFRNYQPRTPELRDLCLPRITSADIEDDIDREIEAAILASEDQDAVLAIAPRKPNWDLKRDVERKMQTLQARTDRAVVQLIRQRIKKDKGPEAASGANPDDERSARDEASLTLAREVAKAGAPKGGDSDDEVA
ncbi:unnamed protein product [Polarella glacialis]|uniref:Coiled-coil domain-containing protein 12 n=1 Tax=Polarella glacialis TaxID=89957 RepID=A0A813EA41_POLGL|nr:unnamed protein product [Polarella glacialis]CAE8595495.1 unnamed protein product [Polarella glacialis]CAE8723494.1 unnamed protein product [Polarella glacialis]|mmetsp:Transcript_55413/g.89576  ORF Transcript_55413/g.89576 Transcript_55413/m.89576 type:complete len:166 (-) Transcript_55413:116-613(-)